jgi:hypothetical protein
MLLVYVLIHKQEIREGKYSPRPMFIGVEVCSLQMEEWEEGFKFSYFIA